MTAPKDITPERFQALLEAYGADPARWPEDERAAAQRFVEQDAEAANSLAQARQLDEVLDTSEALEPSAELRRAVAEIPLRHARPEAGLPWLFGAFWRAAFASAAMLALGFLAGSMSAPAGEDAAPQAVASAPQSVDDAQDEGSLEEDELGELMVLAFLEDEEVSR